MNTKSQHIPLFPLGVFLLPGETTQLHIFENRYKDLLKDCRNEAMGFGIPFSKQLNTKSLGSYVVVTEILQTYPGGEMDVIVKCTDNFRLNKFFFQARGKTYPGGEVIFLENYPETEMASPALNFEFREKMMGLDLAAELVKTGDLTLADIAAHLQMGDSEKLDYAALDHPAHRENFLHNYLRYLELLQNQEASIFKNIYLN